MKFKKILLGAVLLCNCQMANSVGAVSRVKVPSQDHNSNHLLAQATDAGKPFLAQITPDSTLGDESSTVVPDAEVQGVPAELIEGGAERGANLFHSFEEFNVGNGQRVYFANPAGIANIFSRVTGSDVSDIMGTLGVDGGADLFLINPNGIIFGENASLDVNGSFLGSTADSIVFANREFSATDIDSQPLLTINAPIGLNLGNNPGDIVNRSTVSDGEANPIGLSVSAGNNLSFVGGDIEFEGGQAIAPESKIELGGLSAAGTVKIAENGSLIFPENVAKADIALNNGAIVNVRGTDGGKIAVDARNLDLTANSSLEAGIIADSTSYNAQAGDITINLTENATFDAGVINNIVESSGVGNAGDININTVSMAAINRGFISAGTRGQGNAGNININARENIILDDPTGNSFVSNITSRVEPEGMGNAGDITINTNSLSLTGGGIDAIASGEGNAGNINIIATENINIDSKGFNNGILSIVRPTAVGNAGNVNIVASNLVLDNGGNISTDTFGQGDAGSIDLTATGGLSLKGGGFVSSDTFGQGDAGSVNLATRDLTLEGENSTGFPSSISSQVSVGAVGDGGNVTIGTNNLTLINGGQVDASTSGQGNAGLVKIDASDRISVDGEGANGASSRISSRVNLGGVGNAKGVMINTNNLSFTNGGYLDASTFGQGNAGLIEIFASNITFEGRTSTGFPSSAFSQVNPDGVGNAGGITIKADDITLKDGGFISANTLGQGNSGDVNVFTNQLTLKNSGIIEANNFDQTKVRTSGTGKSGNINIEADSLRLTDRASINAVTLLQTGNSNGAANITLQIAEDITLQNNSSISARAFENANGGNIIINNNNGYDRGV